MPGADKVCLKMSTLHQLPQNRSTFVKTPPKQVSERIGYLVGY